MSNSFRYTGQDTIAHTPTDYSKYYAGKSRSYMNRALDASTLSQSAARRSSIDATTVEQHRDDVITARGETMTARDTTVTMVGEAETFRNDAHTERQAAQTARTGAETARDQAGTHATNSATSASTAADILAANQALGITVDTSVGTRVFVGDTMIHGDTGMRDLRDNDTARRFFLQRVGNVVTIKAELQQVAEPPLLSPVTVEIPAGFRPSAGDAYLPLTYSDHRAGLFGGGANISIYDLAAGQVGRVFVTYITHNPWPTTLPGTPA